MQQSEFQVVVIANPFDPEDIQNYAFESKGKNINDLLKGVDTEVVASLNGRIIQNDNFSQIVPKAGDVLAIAVVPAGGDGGAKSILRMVAFLALGFVTFGAGSLFTLSTTSGLLSATATFVGGSLLINEVLPPIQSELPDQSLSSSPSQTYSIDGPKNTSRESIPVPLVFGIYRIAGNLINTRTNNYGNSQEFYGLYNLGEGEVSAVSDVLINDEPAENFNANIAFRLGASSQEILEGFGDTNVDINVGVVFEEFGDEYTASTSFEVSRMELDIVFHQGLFGINQQGEDVSHQCLVLLLYREKGSSDPWNNFRHFENDPDPEGTIPVYLKFPKQTANYYSINAGSITVEAGKVLGDYDDFTAEITSEDYNDQGELLFVQYDLFGVPTAGGARERVGVFRLLAAPSTSADVYRFSGKSRESKRYTITTRNLEKKQYEVRIIRRSPKPSNQAGEIQYYDAFTFTDFRQFRVSGLTFPHTVLLGLDVLLDNQINSLPKITALSHGIKIPVYTRNTADPSQLDVSIESSSNPAWITLALYTNQRWGAKYPISRFALEEFYEWAQDCEANGWQFNGVIDSKMNIHEAARAVAKVGRGKIVPVGTKIGVNVATPKQMEQLFTSSSIIKGSLKINWLPTTDRANVIDCTFFDKNNNHLPRTFRYYNDALIDTGEEFRPTELTLFGVDDYAQAMGECVFALNYNQLSQTISFETDIQGISVRTGSVIGVQHEAPAWATGGRVVSGTSRTVELDRSVVMEADKEYAVLLHYDSLVMQTISGAVANSPAYDSIIVSISPNSSANRVVIDGEDYGIENIVEDGSNSRWFIKLDRDAVFSGSRTVEMVRADALVERDLEVSVGETTSITLKSTAPNFPITPNALMQFSFGEKEKTVKKFIVTNISGQGVETRSISALEYYPELLSDGLVTDLPSFASFPDQIGNIADLRVTEQLIGNSTDKRLNLIASWQYDKNNSFQRANIYGGFDGAVMEVLARNVGNNYTIEGASSYNSVTLKVVPLNANGQEAAGTRAQIVNHVVYTSLIPNPPQGLILSQDADVMNVFWQKPSANGVYNNSLHSYEVYVAEHNHTIAQDGISYEPVVYVPTFPDDYIVVDKLELNHQFTIQPKKRYWVAIVAVNPLLNLKSEPVIEFDDSPISISTRTGANGIEIWYSAGVTEGQTLGNPDTHPTNWTQTFDPANHVMQATLTWSNFVFHPWAVRQIDSDSIGMVYLGEFADFPTSPEEGEMFLHTGENRYYIRRGGLWELFLDRNVSGLTTQYSPNGVQDSGDALYNWSSSFRAGTDIFMRHSVDSGATWTDSIKIVGEDGFDGQYRDYRFARGSSAPALVRTDPNPANWFDEPPAGSALLHMIVTRKNADGSFMTGQQWSLPIQLSGNDGNDGAPGQNAQLYYIGYPNGLAIKNGQNSISLETHFVEGAADTIILGSTDPQLYDGTTPIGRAATLNTSDISGSKVIQLKNGADVLDSVTVLDVTDGTDAAFGVVSYNNALQWVRQPNSGSWAPAVLDTDITFDFYRSGNLLHTRVLRATLNPTTGAINVVSLSNDGNTVVSVLNNNTPSPSIRVDLVINSKTLTTVSERLASVQGGSDGQDGQDGRSVAQLRIYKRQTDQPTAPSGGGYNFTNDVLTPPINWSATIPGGTDPIYVATAIASIAGDSGSDNSLIWSQPELLAQNGETGKSVYQAALYKRATGTPTKPANNSATFNFSTNEFDVLPSGWSVDIPTGSNPIYVTFATFTITGDTGTDSTQTWTTPRLMAENGDDAVSVYTFNIYQRATSTPSTPTGGSYDFTNNQIGLPTGGWSDDFSEGTNPLYVSTATASIVGATGVDNTLTWSTPRKLSENGADGVTASILAPNGTTYRQEGTTWTPASPIILTGEFRQGGNVIATRAYSFTRTDGDGNISVALSGATGQTTTATDLVNNQLSSSIRVTHSASGASVVLRVDSFGETDRPSSQFYRDISPAVAWSNTEANAATPGENVISDRVTLYNESGGYAETRYWDGSNWLAADAVLDGDILFPGSVTAAKINVDDLFAQDINVTGSIVVDSNDIFLRMGSNPGEEGFYASYDGNPFFVTSPTSNLFNGEGLVDNSVGASALSVDAIEFIRNAIGASAPATGGAFEDKFTFKYQEVGTVSEILNVPHGGNTIDAKLKCTAVWTSPTTATNVTANVERKTSATSTWSPLETISISVSSDFDNAVNGYLNVIDFLYEWNPTSVSGDYDYRIVINSVTSAFTKHVNSTFEVVEQGSGGSAGNDGSQLLSSNNVWTGTNRFSGSETRVEHTELVLDNAPIFSRRTDSVAWNNQTVRDPRHIGSNRIAPHKYTMVNGTATGNPYQERWYDGSGYHILEANGGEFLSYSPFRAIGRIRSGSSINAGGQISSDGGGIIAYRTGTPWHSFETGSDAVATLRSDAPYWRVYIGGTLGQPLIEAHMAGHVILKNAGSEKLRTVSDGVDVTGKINTDRLILSNKAAQIYTLSSNFTELKSDDTGIVAMRLRTSDDTIRGSVYANSTNQIGFINNTGTWAFQCGLTSHNNFIGGTLRQSIVQGRTDILQVLRIDNSVNTGNNKCVAELGGLNDAYFHFIMIDDAPQVKQFYFNRNVLVSGRVGAYQSGMYIHSTGVYDDHTRVFSPVNKPDWDDVTNKPPLMEVDNSGYHPGLKPEGVTTGWVRSTAAGIIPHASGGASSSLGTTTWAWNNVWGKYFYAKNSFGIEGVGNYINTIGVYDNNERVFSPNHLPTWTEVASKPPLMEIDLSGTYPIMLPNGVATGWIRTPQEGLLPYEYTLDGNATHRSDIGSVAWRFSYGYFETVDAQLVRAGQTGNYLNYSGVYDNDERVFSPNHLPNWDEVASKPELMHAVKIAGNSYYGLAPEGSDAGWIRTSSSGLIPYQADSANGFSKVGTVSWPFDEVWGVDITAKSKLAINGSSNYINSNGFYGTLFHVNAGNNWNATRLETSRLEAGVHVKIDGSNTLLNSNGVYGDRLQANTSNYINTSGHYGSLFKVNNSNNWDSTRLQATDVRASTRFHINVSNEWTSSLLKATNINVSTRFEINSGNFWDTNGLEAVRVRDTSDVRKKCNFEPITNALEKVCILNGFTYNWKHDPEGERMAGVPAQDLQKVLPEAVCENKDGMLSVVAASEVALLIEAIKELNAKVDEQASEIAELKGRVA